MRVDYRPSEVVPGGVEPFLVDADTGEDMRLPTQRINVKIGIGAAPKAVLVVLLDYDQAVEGVDGAF